MDVKHKPAGQHPKGGKDQIMQRIPHAMFPGQPDHRQMHHPADQRLPDDRT